MNRAFFDRSTTVLAMAALLTSLSFSGPASGGAFNNLLRFGASCLVFFWLAAQPSTGLLKLALAAILTISPTLVAVAKASWWSLSLDHLLIAMLGPHGVLYGGPLLWTGYLGLISVAREKPALASLALAGLVPGTLGLLLSTDQPDVSSRVVTFAPFLLPGIAQSFSKARALAARRPESVLAAAGGLLVLWNLLFMEQYRERLLPSDDTVSFARVTSNSASILSSKVGTPFAWPANWIFAWRYKAPLDRWDSVAGRNLFGAPPAGIATIEFGDDASVFAPDSPLLLEGFGERRTCERGWCRDLDGSGRLLLPLQDDVRAGLVLRLRVRGTGTLRLSLDAATSVSELGESLADVNLRVPARSLTSGINVLSLSVAGGAKATIDRLTLERDPASGSAR